MVLLSILKCTGQTLQQRMIWSKMLVVPTHDFSHAYTMGHTTGILSTSDIAGKYWTPNWDEIEREIDLRNWRRMRKISAILVVRTAQL